ncbi:MAG: thiamine pyrophosphate-dependent enzyme, partial [Bacteroidota bacterium]
MLLGFEGDLAVEPVGPHDFTTEQLRAVLRTMLTSRRLDEKMLTLLKQGKGFFHIGASGHEAAQIGLGMHLRGGHDWFAMYYRDLATALSIGVTAQEVMLAHHARAADPFSGGRQMPEHFSHRDLQIFSTSSSVGAQWVPGVGFALASQRQGTDAVTYISGGEGSTSQGSFHEALNWASRAQAPALFHVQDNGYAISVPVHEQTAGGSIYPLLGGYTGLTRARYDGTDFFTTFAVAKAATEHLRAGRGPVALYADVVRLLPHSSSDDHKKYRPLDELEADLQRDPIARFERRVVNAGLLTLDDVAELRTEVKQAVEDAARWAESQPLAEPSTATQFVVSETDLGLDYESSDPDGELIVMVDAINHALDEEMARDERVLVYGEDVAGGKGGVFT